MGIDGGATLVRVDGGGRLGLTDGGGALGRTDGGGGCVRVEGAGGGPPGGGMVGRKARRAMRGLYWYGVRLHQENRVPASLVSAERARAPVVRCAAMQTASETSANAHSGEPLDAATALAAFRHMVRLRLLSARMVDLQRTEKVAFHASSLGEEAAIVGATLAAREQDWVFPGTREWGAAIVRGMPIAAYVHHAFGTSHDPAKGHAAPDHPPARKVKVAPASGVVGAHVPQAVGAAWAAKIEKHDVATIALFGEGATSTGDFHNALNFAGVFKTPCVLVCRNNGRAVSTPSARQSRSESYAAKAIAYGVASAKIDGIDVDAVLALVREAHARAIAGKGTTLIEITTSPLDAAALSGGDLLATSDRDPIARLRKTLERDKAIDPAGVDALVRETNAEIDAAIAGAESAPRLAPSTLFDDVYSELPVHLRAQKESATWGR